MKITRISAITGISRTFDIEINELEMAAYELGEHISIAMPLLSPAERAFIMTGITAEEWLHHIGIELPDECPKPPTPPTTPLDREPHDPLLLGLDYTIPSGKSSTQGTTPDHPPKNRPTRALDHGVEPDDAANKTPFKPLSYTSSDIDLSKVADADKFQSTNGRWYTKFHCLEELKAHSAWLWEDTSRWIDEPTFKNKLWHWIGTKESAGNDHYGTPPINVNDSRKTFERSKSDSKSERCK